MPLTLPLTYTPLFSSDNFIVTDTNRHVFHSAVAGHSLYLWGASGSGKTHLATLWRNAHPRSWAPLLSSLDIMPILESPAPTLLEDLPFEPKRAQEEALFHLYNALHQRHLPLLITASFPPSIWQASLPDLTTRISTLPALQIAPPDDDLLIGILLKRFSDLSLSVDERTLFFLIKHMNRDYHDIHIWVDRLHHLTLGSRQPITIPLVKKLLNVSPMGDV